jgi:hypothetical protein
LSRKVSSRPFTGGDPGLRGLKNLSPQKWVVNTADVELERSVTLAVDSMVQFGGTVGVFKL